MRKASSTIVVLGLAALTACFEDIGTPSVDEEPCTPGEQRSCGCPGAPEGGIQVCVMDGTGFGECDCGGTGTTAPTSDSTSDSTLPDSASSGPGDDTTTTSPTATTDVTGDPPTTTSGTDGSLVIYSSGVMDGAFLSGVPFGRPVVDALCEAQVPAGADCNVAHAVLSVNDGDTIALFADNYAPPEAAMVVGPTGIPVAESWAVMASADGQLDNSLLMAEVASTDPWMGSLDDGTHSPADCASWSSADSNVIGDVGSLTATDLTWKNAPDTDACNQSHSMLCLCWSG